VFVPTGSASPDFFGGERPGANAHANSVVALRASTGRLVWAFQVVHHDLWDYDVPAQPVLFTLRRGGSALPAVAVGTKMGHLFILDRRTGAPLFPVEERAVPGRDVPGEAAWPTQPRPALPLRLAPESLAAAGASGCTPHALRRCRDPRARRLFDRVLTPPTPRLRRNNGTRAVERQPPGGRAGAAGHVSGRRAPVRRRRRGGARPAAHDDGRLRGGVHPAGRRCTRARHDRRSGRGRVHGP